MEDLLQQEAFPECHLQHTQIDYTYTKLFNSLQFTFIKLIQARIKLCRRFIFFVKLNFIMTTADD